MHSQAFPEPIWTNVGHDARTNRDLMPNLTYKYVCVCVCTVNALPSNLVAMYIVIDRTSLPCEECLVKQREGCSLNLPSLL